MCGGGGCLLDVCVSLVVRDFQGYADPEGGKGAGSGAPISSAATIESSSGGGGGTEEENVVLPLGENVLTNNLGIPIVVVCSKVKSHI